MRNDGFMMLLIVGSIFTVGRHLWNHINLRQEVQILRKKLGKE